MTLKKIRSRSLRSLIVALFTAALPWTGMASAQSHLELQPQDVTEWKSVYGQIQPRRMLPARARLGGTLETLDVIEGDRVEAGQVIGRVVDVALQFRLAANDAQLEALRSQLANAETELARGEELLARGVTTVQRLDGLRTQVEVLRNQIAAAEAEGRVIGQQLSEGDILAPIAGRVLTVPVAAGAIVMPGESVATIGGGGVFLRLAVPERHATLMREGDTIQISPGAEDDAIEGRLARVYPQIENGRVLADVEVEGVDDRLVDARVLVRLPIGSREAFLVPEAALDHRFGLDYLSLGGNDPREHVVQVGDTHVVDGETMVEILAGVSAGDIVVLP
ncbi:efflux RND transporter periplasmic adaptor subunit [Roseibacterium beibuensis]|uniref:Efflux RND transporter periplasmic adaptor subunit n=1 Tax=[Roseibacterium] beibuensis TaxID=1193142 RepID=A0ABP9LFF3_9RHOB|nr:efflux RND transporter periplasmic adaptor subunit [Roseibacterium beibuensis]MCS6623276.1 efflux RND transporter periplasmic adaptor subunit [Roseibacterium beibuensis]